MRYVSTRGQAPELGFADTLLAGLAADGGLYVPASWPTAARRSTRRRATPPSPPRSWRPYVGDDVDRATLDDICDATPTPRFGHPAVCPLVQIGDDEWLLELFHGPTLAFKDLALQVVGRLFDHVLGRAGRAGHDRRAPRSGDTGSRGHRRRGRAATTSTSSSSTRRAGSARCSAGR